MITRFNKYEKKINEESAFPDWVDQKLSKSATKFFTEKDPTGAYETLRGEDKLDAVLTKLYNSPIKDMPISSYVQLTGFMKEEELVNLKLKEPLTTDSTMLEVSNNYYIKNIIDIINDIGKLDIKFATQGLDKNVYNELVKNPITIGTILTNALKSWYNSGQPIESMVQSLSKKSIQPNTTTTNESFQLFERGEVFKSLFKNLGKGSEAMKGIVSTEGKLLKSASAVDSEVRTLSDATEQLARPTRDLTSEIKLPDEFATNIKSAGNQAAESGKINFDVNKPRLTEAPRDRVQSKPQAEIPESKKSEALNSKNQNQVDEIKRLKEEQKLEELRYKNQKKLASDREKFDRQQAKKRERFERSQKRKEMLLSLLKGPGGSLLKWSFYGGIILYGLSWVSEWFKKNDEKSGKTPVKEVLSLFELDMATDNYEPFSTFYKSSKILEASSVSEQPTDICKSFVEALHSNNILSRSDAEKCFEQIKSSNFKPYMQSLSDVASNMMQQLEAKWSNTIELPTPGLKSIGLISAYAAIFSRFENELFGGNVPLTADDKNLDKPVGMIKRFDEKGEQRQYMKIGDSGNDVKQLQLSLNKLGLYDGEINGIYDEELAKIVAGIQDDGQSTNSKIQVNGQADIPTLIYLAQQIELLSMITPSLMATQVNPEELQRRGEIQGYIQQMQSVLASR